MTINMIMVTTDSPEIRMRYVFASGSFFLVVRSSPVFLELYTVVRYTPIYIHRKFKIILYHIAWNSRSHAVTVYMKL